MFPHPERIVGVVKQPHGEGGEFSRGPSLLKSVMHMLPGEHVKGFAEVESELQGSIARSCRFADLSEVV